MPIQLFLSATLIFKILALIHSSALLSVVKMAEIAGDFDEIFVSGVKTSA